MADTKTTALTELTSASTDDLLYAVDDPGGTPLSRKIEIGNLHTGMSAASSTRASVVELATTAETSAGSDAARAVTPDSLAGSTIFGRHGMGCEVFASATALSTGDGKFYFPPLPACFNGMNMVSAIATIFVASSTGVVSLQLARGRQSGSTAHAFTDILTNLLTIDEGEYCSLDATTAVSFISTASALLTGDLIRADVDAKGTGVTGLWVTWEGQLP